MNLERGRRALPPISLGSNRSEDQNLRSGKSDKNQEHGIKQLARKGPRRRAHDHERGQNTHIAFIRRRTGHTSNELRATVLALLYDASFDLASRSSREQLEQGLRFR